MITASSHQADHFRSSPQTLPGPRANSSIRNTLTTTVSAALLALAAFTSAPLAHAAGGSTVLAGVMR